MRMLTFPVAMDVARGYSRQIRAMRYKTWRERKLLTAMEVDAIERMFPSEVPLQGIATQAVNFSRDAVAVAAGVLDGKTVRSAEQVEAIQTICRSNPCGLYRASDGRCGHPKCNCGMRRKPWAAALHCHAGYW